MAHSFQDLPQPLPHVRSPLEAMRHKRGIGQLELAHATGISRKSLYGYESGRRVPDPRNLRKLADYFEVDPLELLSILRDFHESQKAAA